MFGNSSTSSSTFGNIFGNNRIVQTHERLFGGDRNLATKDIAGAQPRQYTRHVWGSHQSNTYTNQLSYDPQQSSIRSPILGDNVQPLNRAIPNSSGMVFRHQQAANATSSSQNTNSASLALAVSPTANLRQSATSLSTAGNAVLQAGSSSPAPKQFERIVNRNSIIPPSQLKEQNIFSSQYFTVDPKLLTKPMVNVQYKTGNPVISHPNTDRPSLQSNVSPSASVIALRNKRSPDSFAQALPFQTEFKRDMISSYQLGRHASAQSDTPFIDQAISQASANPIFAKNRNYGPDSVLHNSELGMQQQQAQMRRTETSQPQASNSQRQATIDDNRPKVQWETHEDSTSQRQVYPVRADHQLDLHNNQAAPLPAAPVIERPPSTQQIIIHPQQHESDQQQPPLSQLLRPLSNRSASGLLHRPQSSVENAYDRTEHKPTQMRASFSQIDNRIKSALSTRGQMVLGSPLMRHNPTSNSEYGTYLNYSRPLAASPQIPVEKVLYQSKRDNFLRAHLTRSQSAEGSRLVRSVLSPRQMEQVQERRNSAIRRGFNIIGNVPMTIPGSTRRNNNYIGDDAIRSELKKSGPSFAGIAGVHNTYTEFNSGNPLYNKNIKSPSEPHPVKFFGSKALKNLSNIKLY